MNCYKEDIHLRGHAHLARQYRIPSPFAIFRRLAFYAQSTKDRVRLRDPRDVSIRSRETFPRIDANRITIMIGAICKPRLDFIVTWPGLIDGCRGSDLRSRVPRARAYIIRVYPRARFLCRESDTGRYGMEKRRSNICET